MKFVLAEASGKQVMVPVEEYVILMNTLSDLSTVLTSHNPDDVPTDVKQALAEVYVAASRMADVSRPYDLRAN